MNKYAQLEEPKNFTDLTSTISAIRLTTELKKVVRAINEDRKIGPIPAPTGFTGTFGPGYAVLWWDDVDNEYRKDLDGARVWRAAAATDPNTVFSSNNAKAVLVECQRTTRVVDIEMTAGLYIYWAQWVNLDGEVSGTAGGFSGTIS